MTEVDQYKVYRHITPDNKCYIGVTKLKLHERFQNGKGYKHCKRFQNAIEQYGWNNIKHEILYTTNDKEKAMKKEIEFIRFFKSNHEDYGFNVEKGGDKKGIRGTDNPFYGKHHSLEQRQKWSLERKGKIAWNKGKYGKINKTNKPIKCIETGEIFECVREAERQLGIIHSSICKCCKGIIKTAGGYHWKYVKGEK